MQERQRPGISAHEDAEREHSASAHGPKVAPEGIEQEGVADSDRDQDRVAREANAVGPHTQTDPLRLLEKDDRDRKRRR